MSTISDVQFSSCDFAFSLFSRRVFLVARSAIFREGSILLNEYGGGK